MRRALAVAIVALGVMAPAAAAKTEVSETGTIRAELSYTRHEQAPATGLVLRVFDAGTKIVEEAIADDQSLSPIGYYTGRKSVSVVDVDGDGAPEAIFDLFTGGAHCCEVTHFYKGATLIEQNWGNPGYVLHNYGGGVPEFRTADDAFSYRYGSYAASLQPLLVLRLVDGKFEDVTRDPSVRPALRREARTFRRLYRKYRRRARKDPVFDEIVRSSLAANAADQCSLHHCARGFALVARALRRGDLPRDPRFLRRVRRDMRKLGYTMPIARPARAPG